MTDTKVRKDTSMEKEVTDYLGTMAPDGRLTKGFLAIMAKESNFVGALFCVRCRNRTMLTRETLTTLIVWGKEKLGESFTFNPLTHYFSTSICPECEQPNENAHADVVEAA